MAMAIRKFGKVFNLAIRWSGAIQIDSFVAHKRRSDLKQLLNRSQLHNYITYVVSKHHFLIVYQNRTFDPSLFQLLHIE